MLWNLLCSVCFGQFFFASFGPLAPQKDLWRAPLHLRFGAEDQLSAEGFSALHRAAQKGHLEVVRLLLSKVRAGGVRPLGDEATTALHLAAANGHVEVVRLLLEVFDKDLANKRGETPLHLAAREGQLEVMRLLLELGADKEKVGGSSSFFRS